MDEALIRIKYLYGFNPHNDGSMTVYRVKVDDNGDAHVIDSYEIPSPGWPMDVVENGPKLPHSRACGFTPHEHGPLCSRDCPTCSGGVGTDVSDELTERRPNGVGEV